MGGAVKAKSPTVAVGISEESSYDDEPNEEGDCDATKTYTVKLDKENTTDMLIENTISILPDYPAEYTSGSPQAYRDLIKDELGLSYQRAKYRVVWDVGVPVENRQPVQWLLIFQPETPEGTETAPPAEVIRTEKWNGQSEKSSEFEIAPETIRPKKDGSYFLLPVDLGVDADRDGEITFDGKDKTTAEKPFRFWINNDHDTSPSTEEAEGTPAQANSNDDGINGSRDLEDFQLIRLDLANVADKIQSGQIQIGLKWKNTGGSLPSVKIYRVHDKIKSAKDYIWDLDKANHQASPEDDTSDELLSSHLGPYERSLGTVAGSSTVWLPSNALTNESSTSSPKELHPYLLFEGVVKGQGQLCLVIKVGSVKAEVPGIWLNLLDVEQMFQSAQGTFEGVHAPDEHYPNPPDFLTWDPLRPGTSFQLKDWPGRGSFQQDSDETDEAIIMVHGWNMTDSDRRTFSESFYKRLWWKGYKGRFASFAWPTYNSYNDFLGLIPTHYNMSEYVGWKYGPALKAYVNSIPKSVKNVAAHSMGNIVMASALKAGLQVNNYVAMEAAIPSGCYDASDANNQYGLFTSAEQTRPTPDKANPDLGYRGVMAGISGNFHNFYSANDFALATGTTLGKSTCWEANQIDHKPNDHRDYAFYPSAIGSAKYRIEIPFGDESGASGFAGRNITDHHEIMSFIARPLSRALGAQHTGGFSDLNLANLARYPFGRDRTEHSGQYQRRIQMVHMFYNTLLQKMQVGFNFLDE